MKIEELRKKIDCIDDELSKLYVERMSVSKQIGEVKAREHLPVNVSKRENDILARICKGVDEDKIIYLKQLYDEIFLQSKNYQSSLREESSPTVNKIREVLSDERKSFPISATIACQGVEGAYSGMAAKHLFQITDITYFKNFEGVFNAVEKGLCDYGVLPIENSTAGSVLPVYDLMKKHNFYIVKSIRLPINHCLAAKEPNKKITKIITHEQALMQCAEFIKKTGVPATAVENTAVAAQMAANSEENIAAICSVDCAKLYNLSVVEENVQDADFNFTRFICISNKLRIFKGADKISVMTALEHKVGSLNTLLSRFYTQGLNLTKLESRPVGGRDFEFMFYFDFEGDVESKGLLNLLADLENSSDKFVFLGSYKETI